MRKAIIGASLVVLATTGAGYAQSAEETVLFVVENIEAGAYNDGETTVEYKLVSEKPFELKLDKIKRSSEIQYGYVQSVKVLKSGDCTFDILTEYAAKADYLGNADKSKKEIVTISRQTWDFSRIEGFKVWGPDSFLAVEPRKFCKIEHTNDGAQERKCELFISHAPKDLSRVQKAFAHLRANYCKARAF